MGLTFKRKRKKIWDKPFSEKVAKRVSRIPTGELAQWAEQALYETNRVLDTYLRTYDDAFLEEALIGAEAVHAVINEYYNRSVV